MRLTEKLVKGCYADLYPNDYQVKEQGYETLENDTKNAIDKLGQLEDLEEELGTDFLILAKAKKNGIYRKMADGIEFYPRYVLSVYIDHVMVNTSGKQLFLFEYGKTWALTKEELL